MRLKALAVAVALATGAALSPQIAAAAALPGSAGKAVQSQAAETSLKQEVQSRRRYWRHRHLRHRHYHRPRYRGRCARVRRDCAYRFGWGTRSHYRCVVRRGC